MKLFSLGSAPRSDDSRLVFCLSREESAKKQNVLGQDFIIFRFKCHKNASFFGGLMGPCLAGLGAFEQMCSDLIKLVV